MSVDRATFIKNLKRVKDIEIGKNISVSELIDSFELSGGFTARKIFDAAQILIDMINDKESTNFLSFPAALVATGTRGILKELISRKFFDVIITTCGTIDHDLARCWKNYYGGWFEADDTELANLNIFRLGNVFIPLENYGLIIEEKTQSFLRNIYDEGIREIATYELLSKLGEFIDKNCQNKEKSIIWWAWKNDIPIIIPGITDGAFGYQLWLFKQEHKDFKIDVFRDESKLDEIIYNSKRTGALIIGGGISKHHVIWWNQYKNGLDRVIYITTAVEWDGSLSGARTREAISWHKISQKARHITVEGDATVILPLITAYVIDKLSD